MTTEQAWIDVRILDVRPHPDQVTNNPGTWAVKLRVSRADGVRTFWRWHTVREIKNGCYVAPLSKEKPSPDEILTRFWDDTFAELHGFDFERVTVLDAYGGVR